MVKKYKKDSEVSYTLGLTLTIELVKTKPEVVLKIYTHPDLEMSAYTIQFIADCEKLNIPIETNAKVFNILSQKDNCFVIGEFKKYNETLKEEDNHIVLVNPSNAGNLGTILRSSVGFGVNNIAIIRPGVDIFDPKTIRASMGAIFHMNFCYYDSFLEYQNIFNKHHIYTFMLQSNTSIHNVLFKEPFSLVFGNEATGLPNNFLEYGESVIIPHSKEIDSLNLPVAVSIALYETSKIK